LLLARGAALIGDLVAGRGVDDPRRIAAARRLGREARLQRSPALLQARLRLVAAARRGRGGGGGPPGGAARRGGLAVWAGPWQAPRPAEASPGVSPRQADPSGQQRSAVAASSSPARSGPTCSLQQPSRRFSCTTERTQRRPRSWRGIGFLERFAWLPNRSAGA